MTYRHPFQKLCIVPGSRCEHRILLAASGPSLNCIALETGELLYQWPSQSEPDTEDEAPGKNGERPNKRRKVAQGEDGSLSRQPSEASDASLEIVAERKKGERKKTKVIDEKLPNVSHILATADGRYAIAVTVEDKAIRVFEITLSGKLRQLSQRSLPKKLCALRLTTDERTILAADKFGDVYALPLHPSEDWTPKPKAQGEKAYKPSASELTVHTKGNLQALRQQQDVKKRNPKKEGPQFEHRVLLGHVSLLTDLLAAEASVDGKKRPYIITADRDEHIRVSRGIPQTHIIENFCLGHKEFVTRLCISPAAPELLLVGGGEANLSIYHWQTGKLKETHPLWPFGRHLLANDEYGYETPLLGLPEGRLYGNLAVSGIWSVKYPKTLDSPDAEQDIILVAIEGIPLLFTYVLTSAGLAIGIDTIRLAGNILDIVAVDDSTQVLVSLDTVHRPFSMKSYNLEPQQESFHLQALSLGTHFPPASPIGRLVWKKTDLPAGFDSVVEALPEAPQYSKEDETTNTEYEKIFSPLGEFLYGLENLRKKRGAAVVEEEEVGSDVDIT